MSKHQPALLGALFIGILSALPGVNIANCCCLWVLSGGALVVYLQQQRTLEPVDTADAVIGGLLAGVLGALISSLLTYLVMAAGGVDKDEARHRLARAGGSVRAVIGDPPTVAPPPA